MSIPASVQIPAIQEANRSVQFVDKNGMLTQNGFSVLDAVFNFVNGCSRQIPCNASTTSNVITLTMLATSPLVKQYSDFDVYQFIADATTTGSVTALVVTPQGSLATINVYKTNGATQAGSGDITSGRQYEFTFVDSLNSGNGGFVLR